MSLERVHYILPRLAIISRSKVMSPVRLAAITLTNADI